MKALLGRDQRGVTVVEFGIVLLPLLAVIFGLFELGYQAYIKSVAAGALETAIRDVSIGNKSSSAISAKLKDDIGVIVDRKYVTINVQSFVSFDAVGSPEKLTDDKNGNGQYDAGDCFRDANDNGRYDTAATAGRGNSGGGEDVVSYTVTVYYPHLFPVDTMFGWPGRGTIVSKAVMRNQPYAKAATPGIVCA